MKRAKKEAPLPFREWFRQQFGGLPRDPDEREALRITVSDLRWKLVQCEALLRQDDELQAQWRAASYARLVKKWGKP